MQPCPRPGSPGGRARRRSAREGIAAQAETGGADSRSMDITHLVIIALHHMNLVRERPEVVVRLFVAHIASAHNLLDLAWHKQLPELGRQVQGTVRQEQVACGSVARTHQLPTPAWLARASPHGAGGAPRLASRESHVAQVCAGLQARGVPRKKKNVCRSSSSPRGRRNKRPGGRYLVRCAWLAAFPKFGKR